MQEDEELFVQIIKDSNKKLMVLKLLCNFFNHRDLIGALIRTKIIHNLFEKNRALDINKLELFHIQYTVSLVELFQKLKYIFLINLKTFFLVNLKIHFDI